MRDDGEAQDVGYETKRERMSSTEYSMHKAFLDGVPATATIFHEDGHEQIDGRLNGTTFYFVRDFGPHYGAYYLDKLPGILAIVGVGRILGQVKERKLI